MKKDKLDFYAEVKVSNSIENPEICGKVGVIMGISEDENAVYGYSVHLKGDKYSVFINADEVAPTGRKFSREDFYDGSYLKVSKCGKTIDAV